MAICMSLYKSCCFLQEDLADELSRLVHLFNRPAVGLRFVEAFFHTEAREWYGIDNLRLDKFMMVGESGIVLSFCTFLNISVASNRFYSK